MTTSDPPEMQVQQTVPLLVVSDLVESRKFYCNGLGFQTEAVWESAGRLAWCRLQQGGAALMLQQDCDEDPPASARGKGVILYFLCKDADALYREFTDRGIKATEPTVAFYGMKQTFVTDPDGYELCFEHRTGDISPAGEAAT